MVEDSSITKRASPGWWFWFWWVIVTTAIIDLACFFGFSIVINALGHGVGIYNGFLLVIAFPAMATMGFGQWFVIRKYIFRSGLWILSGLIGGVIGPAATLLLLRVINLTGNLFIGLALLWIVSQTIMSLLQALILSFQIPRVGLIWWMLATAIGMVGSLIIGVGLYTVYPNSELMILFYILIGAPFGVITGLSLMRLLR
jgi:hypothetical protein